MNYQEKLDALEAVFGHGFSNQYADLAPFLFEYADRLVLDRSANRALEVRNPTRASFAGTRTWRSGSYVAKSLVYHALPRRAGRRQGPHVIVSPTIHERFPHLTPRLGERSDVTVCVTKPTASSALGMPGVRYLGIDGIIYTPSLERGFHLATTAVHDAIAGERSLGRAGLHAALAALDSEIGDAVSRLADVLERAGATQFVSAFSNRYDEIFVARACATLDLPSKEICHGVNAHSLDTSDNVVPTNADLLYVWSDQFARGLGAFPEQDRIKVGGYPKYDAHQIDDLQRRHPRQRLIVYFSQPAKDVGATTAQPVTPEYREAERRFRRRLLDELHVVSRKLGYRVRVRYHRGEREDDRQRERALLAEYGFEVGRGSFDQDLWESDVCVGINTSCLWEAHVTGRKVWQLPPDEWQSVHFDEVPLVEVEGLADAVASEKEHPPVRFNRLMDVDTMLADGIPNSRNHAAGELDERRSGET